MVAAAMVACGDDDDNKDDIIWDIAPYDVSIEIVDEDGTALLNPTVDGNWMEQPFSMTYNGKEYEADWTVLYGAGNADMKSRYIPAYFYGLRCVNVWFWDGSHWYAKEDEYQLAFGEFPSDEDKDLSFEFYVPGREEPYRIAVEKRFWWNADNEPDGYKKVWLDGKEVDFPITIVLPRRTE